MSSFRRINAHFAAARAYASLSRAIRLKVGAVLIRDDRIISVGYNGMPSGGSNVCEVLVDGKLITRPAVLHAEENCIAFAAKNGIATNGCTLITTHSPCYPCCRLLIQAGVREVWYETEYRDTAGLTLLKKHNVTVRSLHEEKARTTSSTKGAKKIINVSTDSDT